MPKYTKRRIVRKRKQYRKRAPYRKAIARIPRPLNVKARSAMQHVTYYNSFFCDPALDGASPAQQQNWAIKLQLNSPWIFNDGWDILATNTNQRLLPNQTVTPVSVNAQPVIGTTTCMPGVADGPKTILKYAQGCVVGTKVTLVATPISSGDDSDPRSQSGLFYAIKHSQKSSGLVATTDINKINSLPFRQAKQITSATSGTASTSNTRASQQIASRITVTHSPKKFNNVRDLKDNNQFNFTGGSGTLSQPEEGDFLTIGIVPMLKTYPGSNNQNQAQAPRFRLDMRVEQKILWTEPLEETSTGQGNYSYPYSAYKTVMSNAPFLALGYGAAAYRRYGR